MCVLDLDDDEVQTRERLARLAAESQATPKIAAFEAAEAKKYAVAAKRYLPAFDRVTVCAAHDATRLGAPVSRSHFHGSAQRFCVPADFPVRRPRREGTLRLLLVGTFGCYANRDAAFFLARDVLPALCRLTGGQTPNQFSRQRRSDGELGELALNPIIKVHDYVDDLRPLYSRADVAVVPIRAGGGTRIKILEAFAHGVPVVSTRIGAEGISVADGEHLLLADDADGVCARLPAGEGRSRASRGIGRASLGIAP